MMKVNEKDQEVLERQYLENEKQTNRVVAYASLVFFVQYLLMELSIYIDYSEVIHRVTRHLFRPIAALIVLFFFIAWKKDYDGPGVKYMLLSGIILVSTGLFFVYTTYMSYLVFLPVFIAARYFNKKFMIQVSVTTLILFLLSCYLNLLLEPISETIQFLHKNAAYNSWLYPIDAHTFIIVPMLVTFLFVSFHSINETTNGRKLLEAKAVSLARTAAVEAELNMASEIQKDALPAGSFTTPDGNFRIAATEIPAREVGGDFYDYFMINDHILTVLIADVSDKGAAAAMFMMSAKKAIQCAVQCCHDLDSSIKLANTLICQDNKSDMFLTLWLGIIDTRSGVGKYINAGHPRPIIRHLDGTTCFVANEPDLFLGNFPDMSPRVNIFRMKKGDILLLNTDGITDAMNHEGKSFGNENLMTAVKQSAVSSDEVINTVIQAANEFSKGQEQFDDMTLLALQCLSGSECEELVFDVRADESGTRTVIDGVESFLEKLGCPDEKRRNIEVVCDEMCVNISDYAYDGESGPMRVEAKALSNFITLSFIDGGSEFDPLAHADPEISNEPIIGGLGIFFVKSLVDEISYRREDNKNILTVTIIWDV